jgi:hypothetical protein
VVGNVVANAGDARSFQQLQENMELGQALTMELQKSLPDNYKVGAGKGVDLALAKKLSDYFGSKVQPTTPSNQALSIAVNTPLWELGYVSFLTSQDYALNYNLQVVLLEQKEGIDAGILSDSFGALDTDLVSAIRLDWKPIIPDNYEIPEHYGFSRR